jgi:hypothetical protein
MGVVTIKGATSVKVSILTKDYNVHMVFMYWFIKSHNYIINNIFGLDVDIETKYDPYCNNKYKCLHQAIHYNQMYDFVFNYNVD